MPPDAGHDKHESAPATIFGFFRFSCRPTVLFTLATWARLPRPFSGNVPPEEHLQAQAMPCMTMTLAGLPSRCRKANAFPFIHNAAFHILSLWRVAPLFIRFLFLLSLSMCMPMSRAAFRTASDVIFVAGAKVKTGLGTKIFIGKISTPAGSISP